MIKTRIEAPQKDIDPNCLKGDTNKSNLMAEYCKSHLTDECDSFPSLDESSISIESSVEPIENKDSPTRPCFSFVEDIGTGERPFFDDSYMSVDPFYSFSAEELQSKVHGTPTRCNCDDLITVSLKWISSRMFPLSSGDVDDSFSSK